MACGPMVDKGVAQQMDLDPSDHMNKRSVEVVGGSVDDDALKRQKLNSFAENAPGHLAVVGCDQPRRSLRISYVGTAGGWANLGQFASSTGGVIFMPPTLCLIEVEALKISVLTCFWCC